MRERTSKRVKRGLSHFVIMAYKEFTLAALVAAIVSCESAAAASCYPTYFPGRTYANGDWASASTRKAVALTFVACSPPGVNDCPVTGSKIMSEEGFSSFNEMHNYKCMSDELLCSKDAYAPGSGNSDKAWARESSPCSSVSHQFPNDVYSIHVYYFEILRY